MLDDDDYPADFDVEPDLQKSQSEESSDGSHHILGPPPESYFSDDEDRDSVSSVSDFDINNYPEYIEDEFQESPPNVLPLHLVSSGRDRDERVNQVSDVYGVEHDENYEEQMKHDLQNLLPSALCANSLLLRNGFQPEDVCNSLAKTARVDLVCLCYLLLGNEIMDSLPNNSKLEMCHALERHGWLTFDGEKFFPIIPDSEKEFVNEIVNGAEQLRSHEDNRKKEAEIFPSEEAEIRACLTFNLISDLLMLVRNEQKQNLVKYSFLMNAFESMIAGDIHQHLLTKYRAQGLPLEEDEKWNSEWFKKYTNRSSLNKFLKMPKFASIVVHPNSEFAFRDINDLKRLTEADLEVVRQRWRKEKTGNKNREREQRERNDSGPRTYQSKRKEIVADPDFVAAAFKDEDDVKTDNRSVNMRGRDYQSRSRSRSRSERREKPKQKSLSRERHSRNVSPSRRQGATPPPCPFGAGPSSAPAQPRSPDDDNDEVRRQVRNIPDNGYTTTEDEISSNGEYTDDDEETKARRVQDKEARRQKKMKKQEERAKRPKPPMPDLSNNRFNCSSFNAPHPDESRRNRSISGGRSRVNSSKSPPRQPKLAPPPPQPQLAFSGSSYDELNRPKPFRADPALIEENRKREEEKRRKEEMEAAEAARKAREVGRDVPNEKTQSATIPAFTSRLSEQKESVYTAPELPMGMRRNRLIAPVQTEEREEKYQGLSQKHSRLAPQNSSQQHQQHQPQRDINRAPQQVPFRDPLGSASAPISDQSNQQFSFNPNIVDSVPPIHYSQQDNYQHRDPPPVNMHQPQPQYDSFRPRESPPMSNQFNQHQPNSQVNQIRSPHLQNPYPYPQEKVHMRSDMQQSHNPYPAPPTQNVQQSRQSHVYGVPHDYLASQPPTQRYDGQYHPDHGYSGRQTSQSTSNHNPHQYGSYNQLPQRSTLTEQYNSQHQSSSNLPPQDTYRRQPQPNFDGYDNPRERNTHHNNEYQPYTSQRRAAMPPSGFSALTRGNVMLVNNQDNDWSIKQVLNFIREYEERDCFVTSEVLKEAHRSRRLVLRSSENVMEFIKNHMLNELYVSNIYLHEYGGPKLVYTTRKN